MNDKRKRMRFTTPSWAAGSRSCKARLVAAPRQFLQHDRMLWRRNKTQSSPMRRSILDEYSLLKDLWKGLSVECNRHLVPAKGFGLVERVVGFSDRRAQVALLQRSDPDADRDLEHLAADLDRQPGKRRADAFGDTPAFPDIDPGQDGGELLPAIARDEIARPHRIAQKIGEGQQRLIAAGMAKPLIDVREKVEVHHQDARGCVVHLSAPTETMALFEKGSAIRQFRQFVGERELCVAVSQALGRHHQQTKRDADEANGGDEQCNA